MKILFAGTPEIAVPTLKALSQHKNCTSLHVLTNPDRPTGRGRRIEASPVKKTALDLEIPFFQPEKIDEDFIIKMKQLNFDILICFAYGKIFSERFLSIFPKGGVNIHPSLLPKYRGPSPISSAIFYRDKLSGITLQTLSKEMDCGDILIQEEFTLGGRETTESLTQYCADSSALLLNQLLDDFDNLFENKRKQNDLDAHYCRKIKKEDAVLDFNKSAIELDSQIRAISPNPKCYTFYKSLELYIIEAQPIEPTGHLVNLIDDAVIGQVIGWNKKDGIFVKTGDGFLAVKKLQIKTRKILDWKSFVNGLPEFKDAILGDNDGTIG